MSWSVSAAGTIADVKTELERQFSYPLAASPAGLSDDGERETVRRVRDTIEQCLDTFGSEKTVHVTASGHMGFGDWTTTNGGYQQVNVSIQPTS